jgi:hypothetical protein
MSNSQCRTESYNNKSLPGWLKANLYCSTVAPSLTAGAQGLGQIVGPNIAASILGVNLGYSTVFIMCGTMALGGLSIYTLAYVQLHKTFPALADAS